MKWSSLGKNSNVRVVHKAMGNMLMSTIIQLISASWLRAVRLGQAGGRTPPRARGRRGDRPPARCLQSFINFTYYMKLAQHIGTQKMLRLRRCRFRLGRTSEARGPIASEARDPGGGVAAATAMLAEKYILQACCTISRCCDIRATLRSRERAGTAAIYQLGDSLSS